MLKLTVLFARNEDVKDYLAYVRTSHKFYKAYIQKDLFDVVIREFKSAEEGNEDFLESLQPDIFGDIDYRKGTQEEQDSVRQFILDAIQKKLIADYLK